MHPDTYVFLAGERIADLRRDADRRRLTSQVARGGRATILYREPSAPVVASSSRTPLTGHRGAG
jgi:hypothetical protein